MNRQELFNYMKNEHDVTLLETDMIEIERIVMKSFHAQSSDLDTLIQRVEGHKHTVFHPHDSFLSGWNKAIDIILEDLRSAPVENCICDEPKPMAQNMDNSVTCITCRNTIEVCEWEQSRLIDTCYYPDCVKFLNSNSIIDRENYIYCPFCSKKIKRV